jgi:hypothetical protein
VAIKRQSILSDALEGSLSEYLESTRVRIVERATEIASMPPTPTAEDASGPAIVKVEIIHLAKAIEEVTPGFGGSLVSSRVGFFDRISGGLTSFTGVSAILAILFSILGLCALLVPAAKDLKGQSQAFLDVAKIFAGAVVGSAGVTVVSRGRKRPQ